MQSIKAIDVHRDIKCVDAVTGETVHLSYYNKHHMHKLVRKMVHPLHVFDYDNVVILCNFPENSRKLYQATFGVLLMSGRKVRYSINNVKLTQGTYTAYVKEDHLK